MGWSLTVPASSEAVSGSTASIRANWDAIAAAFSVEHGALTSASLGQHSTGAGFLKYGTTLEIATLTSPGTGALTYNNELGIFYIRHASDDFWGTITRDYFSRVYMVAGSVVITPSTYTKINTFGTPVYDGLGEYSSSRITIKNTGFYQVIGFCKFSPYGAYFLRELQIRVNGVAVTSNITVKFIEANMEVSDILSLTTGDYIELYTWHNSTVNQTISSASMTLTRLS